jgi:hypothetical protein
VLTCYLDGSLRPTLATIAASIRAPELYAVEGVVMRLLAEMDHRGQADCRRDSALAEDGRTCELTTKSTMARSMA